MGTENNCEHSATEPHLNSKDTSIKEEHDSSEPHRPEPVDWKPQDKCYFCVDGKLLKVNEIGDLVVEPVAPDTELNKNVSSISFEMFSKNLTQNIWFQQIIESEDSSDSSDIESVAPAPQQNIPKSLEALLRSVGATPNMTSLESLAAQFAAIQSMQTGPGMNPFLNYQGK